MLVLIILLPLFGFFFGIAFGRYNGKGTCFITSLTVFSSFFISFYFFIKLLFSGTFYKVTLFPWIFSDFLTINWNFYFDSLTLGMLIVITFISTLVHIYSIEYMKEDPHLNRFMSYLSLFTFFMLVLVTSNNFLQLFVGWEGVGLSSYLLINFWFTRIQANKSSIKAMVLNRIGDFFFLIAIFSLYLITNSLDFDVIFSLVTLIKEYYIQIGIAKFCVLDLICLCLFLGATGKSAQLGLHSWLPDAMEGPTPVSALIHAATMVTAGVFLIIRCSFLFEYSPLILNLIIIIGSITALFAATTGLLQNDIKRVIAYSTCSQLGYMFFACGLSSYDVGFFHLYNHAFFKALLFLGAGSVIHALANEQDMRKMGGLRIILPFSYSIMLIGSLSLIGFPFLSGFYSKDVILEIAYAKYNTFGHFAYYLGVLAAFCTAFYSTRVLILVFLINTNGFRTNILNAHEGSYFFVLPLFFLTILSIISGYLSKDLFIGFGTDFWSNVIFILPYNYSLSDIEFLNLFNKILPLLVVLIGIFSAIFLYFFTLPSYFNYKQTKWFKYVYIFLNRKWFFDKFIVELIGINVLTLSYLYNYKDIDRGVLENFGPFGIINNVNNTIKKVKKIQTGYIYHYMFYIFIAILILFIFSLINFNYILILFLFVMYLLF
uniref:NADH-ubiquinone oxidoreductase chain 5 n=1 Tax=Synura synuroidea TaxID=47573 RepID=Q9MGB1_9STRA|nr:NADH dehydrogenase subunit 5 [Synura synuroidea]AAF36938.1 NADH dehydrogenase subunit 5 [Synura synuroidea]